MKLAMPLALCILVGASAASGCGPSAPRRIAKESTLPAKTHRAPPRHTARDSTPPVAAKPASGNELGVVPILEYHTFGPTEGRWQRTPQGLYADLTWLYEHNFMLVTMGQYESGTMNIPAGKHPAVLTFDDGDSSQFEWNSAHIPLPNSAVGVLEAFQQAHPGFRVTATFFLNDHPFGADSVEKMQWLVAHGFELGNHTFTHADINTLNAAGIEREIGQEQAYIEQAVPGYVPVSFALPYGGLPRDPADRAAVLNGSYQGTTWHFLGVALVGAGPAPSPFSRAFSVSIPRIQVGDPALVAPSTRNFIFSGYAAQFAKNPSMLYTSDGSAHWISYPTAAASQLNPAYTARANPVSPISALPEIIRVPTYPSIRAAQPHVPFQIVQPAEIPAGDSLCSVSADPVPRNMVTLNYCLDGNAQWQLDEAYGQPAEVLLTGISVNGDGVQRSITGPIRPITFGGMQGKFQGPGQDGTENLWFQNGAYTFIIRRGHVTFSLLQMERIAESVS